jgi:hypothetical protein
LLAGRGATRLAPLYGGEWGERPKRPAIERVVMTEGEPGSQLKLGGV